MSTLKDAYDELGADYNGVLKRLVNEALVTRFVGKFFDDDSFAKLEAALAEHDVKAAFMAAHTLKGVCQNLGFSNLYEPASALTEILRANSLEGTEELFAQVKEQYERTIATMAPAVGR